MKQLLLWSILFVMVITKPAYAGEEEKLEKIASEMKQIEEKENLLMREITAAHMGAMILSSEYQASVEAYLALEKTNRWNLTLDETEKDLLYRIVMLEAGGEGSLGQQAVTEVILNRITSPLFPNTLVEVLSQKSQFTTWRMRGQTVPSQEVIDSVESVLRGETAILPMNTLYFSRGGENRKIQTRIGGHIFCNQ